VGVTAGKLGRGDVGSEGDADAGVALGDAGGVIGEGDPADAHPARATATPRSSTTMRFTSPETPGLSLVLQAPSPDTRAPRPGVSRG
jgi:hypothetical protein